MFRLALMVCALAAIGGSAAASPLEDPSLAGGATFTGPMRPHGTSTFINPAALAMASRGSHVLILGSARLSQLWIDREIATADGSTEPGPSVFANTVSPGGLLAFDFSIADRWRIGLSLHSPIARRFTSGEDALRYHTLGGHTYQTTGTFAFSIAAHERVLLGFGISLGYSSVRLDFARDTALDDGTAGISSDCGGAPCGIENPLAAERYQLRARTPGIGGLFAQQNLGFVAGIMVRVTDHWWLGLSAIAPPGSVSGQLELTGDTEVERAPRDGGGTLRGDAEINFDNSESIYLGVRGPIGPSLELLGHVRWENGSVHDRYDLRMFGGNLEDGAIPTQWPRYQGQSDVFSAVVGVESPEEARFRYGARLSAETGSVSARAINPLEPHPWNVGANGGLEMRLGDHLVLTGVYGLTLFPPVGSDDSAFDPLDRIACVDQDFDLDACVGARQGRAVPTAAGDYLRIEHLLQLSLRYDSL